MTGMEHAIEQVAQRLHSSYCECEGWYPKCQGAQVGDRRVARRLAAEGLIAPAPLTDTITIPRPHVPHGPKHLTANAADVHYLRDAAQQIEEHYKPFGSNLRATVVKLIRDAADAVDRAEGGGSVEPEPSVPAAQLRAFARMCVDGGDMTPAAARMLGRIINSDWRAGQ